jgi:lipopolysaccharide export system permease protein
MGMAGKEGEAGVFWSIINRTIFLELLKVFTMALVGITGLLLLAGIVSEASKEGLGPGQILAIIPLIVPSTLPYTIPATTLFACCVIYGRLAADNEILAIKSTGVNVMRVVAPGLFLGVLMSVVTYGLSYALIPYTHHLLRCLFLNDVENLLYHVLENEGSFKHPKLDYEIHVRKVEGRKLIDAQFMHKNASGSGFDVIARAKEAELLWERNNKKINVHMRFCTMWSDKNNTAYVEEKVWPVDLPPDLFDADKKFRPSDMTWQELLKARVDIRKKIEEREAEIAVQVARLGTTNPPDDLPLHIQNLRNIKKRRAQELLDVDVELNKRPSLALGCLCFVLVGCPVGIWFSRSDYLSAFVTCFLPIVLFYYPLLLCGLNLARASKTPLTVGMWGANIVIGVLSLGLYRKLTRN